MGSIQPTVLAEPCEMSSSAPQLLRHQKATIPHVIQTRRNKKKVVPGNGVN